MTGSNTVAGGNGVGVTKGEIVDKSNKSIDKIAGNAVGDRWQ